MAATLSGSKLVLPGENTDAEGIARLIDREEVTVTAAVTTVWLDMAQYYDENEDVELESLDRVLIGGTSPPEWLMEKFDKEIDAPIHQGYGMTEAAPHLVNTMTTTEVRELSESERYQQQMKPGISAPGVRIRLRTPDGESVPHDGESAVGQHHRVEFVGPEDGLQRLGVPHVSLDQLRDRPGDLADPVQHRALGIAEVVEDHHVVAVENEFDDGVRADEARSAGHEDVHR